MVSRSFSRNALLCGLMVGAMASNAAAGVVCTDRWGHRYNLANAPSEQSDNIKCTEADGSPLRKPSSTRARSAPAAAGMDRTYASGTQPPAPVTTAVIKPNRSGPVEPQSMLGLKNPQPTPVNPSAKAPANATQVFGFGGNQALPAPPAAAPTSASGPAKR